MDRPIDNRARRRRVFWRVGWGALGAGAVVLLFGFLGGLLRPGVARDRLRTARVESGRIEATLTASGTVVPEVEQVISSPVDARVLRILKRPGDRLEPGEAILKLDLSDARLAVEKLEQALAIKRNEEARTRQELEARLEELAGQREVVSLELEAQRARTRRDRELFGKGFLSQDELDQSVLTEARAKVELEKIENEIRHARRSTATQVRGLGLERATVERDRDQARRVLDLATTKADRKAVLTWTVTEEGAAVKQGETIARLADLSAFRVEASVSDIHAQRLRVGQNVIVQISEGMDETGRLEGRIASIEPTVKEGGVTFAVALDDRGSALLRANMRVDVLVVVGEKARALRVRRGPFADGEGRREVFVVRGDRAVRTAVELGLSGPTHLEVVRGLALGDEVIISDMSAHLHQRELELQ